MLLCFNKTTDVLFFAIYETEGDVLYEWVQRCQNDDGLFVTGVVFGVEGCLGRRGLFDFQVVIWGNSVSHRHIKIKVTDSRPMGPWHGTLSLTIAFVSLPIPFLLLPHHHLIKRAFLLPGNRCVNLCEFALMCVCVWPGDIFRTEQTELHCQSVIHSLLACFYLFFMIEVERGEYCPCCPFNTHNALCVYQIHHGSESQFTGQFSDVQTGLSSVLFHVLQKCLLYIDSISIFLKTTFLTSFKKSYIKISENCPLFTNNCVFSKSV